MIKGLAARLFLSASLAAGGIAGVAGLSGCSPAPTGGEVWVLNSDGEEVFFNPKQTTIFVGGVKNRDYTISPNKYRGTYCLNPKINTLDALSTTRPQTQEQVDFTGWLHPNQPIFIGGDNTRDCTISPDRSLAEHQGTIYRLNKDTNLFDTPYAAGQQTRLFDSGLPTLVICNDWVDKHNPGFIDADELEGLGKSTFRSGEGITIMGLNKTNKTVSAAILVYQDGIQHAIEYRMILPGGAAEGSTTLQPGGICVLEGKYIIPSRTPNKTTILVHLFFSSSDSEGKSVLVGHEERQIEVVP